MKLIGIAGKSGSGKTTVAGFLTSALIDRGYRVDVDAIGAEIKRRARRDHGWDGRKDAAGRALLQGLGAEGREVGGPPYWLDQMVRWHRGSDADYLIVSDVRFEAEAAQVRDGCAFVLQDKRDQCGVVWLVTGRGGLAGRAGQDPTELGVEEIRLDVADTEIRNGPGVTFERLRDLVNQAVEDGRHDFDAIYPAD